MLAKMRFFFTLRFKLLAVFTVVFTIAFGVVGLLAYDGFTDYAVDLATSKLQSDANYLSVSTVNDIDPEDFYALAEDSSNANAARDNMLESFNYLIDEYPDMELEFSIIDVGNDQVRSVLYYADGEVLELENPPYQVEITTEEDREDWQEITEVPVQYQISEEAGTLWTSSSDPILEGEEEQPTGGVLFIDIRTDDQIAIVRRQVRNILLLGAAISYPILFLATFLVAFVVSRNLYPIVRTAQALEHDEAYDPAWLKKVASRSDELGNVARVFDKMAREVQERHQKLKQEVARLKVEIDHAKKEKQVSEITESDYFKDIQEKVAEMRKRKTDHISPPTENKSE